MKTISALFTSLLLTAACSSGTQEGVEEEDLPKDFNAPTIIIDTPTRGTMTEGGVVEVTGRASDAETGIASVTVAGQVADLREDGSFQAIVNLPQGVTLIETVATDLAGNTSDDLRAVLAGTMAEQGTPVSDAIVAHVNDTTLDVLGGMVTDLADNTDFGNLAASFNPIVDTGGSCLGAEVDIRDITKGAVEMELQPVNGGVDVAVTVHDLDVDMRASWKVACLGGGAGLGISSDTFTVTGRMVVDLDSAGNLAVDLENVQGDFGGFDFRLGAIPSQITGLIEGPVEREVLKQILNPIKDMVPSMGESFFSDLTRDAYTVDVFGAELSVAVQPTTIDMSSTGIRIGVESTTELEGVEGASYIVTPRPAPEVDAMGAQKGLQVAIADDMANQLLANFWASGLLEAAIAPELLPHMQGLFGANATDAKVTFSLPPVVSADPSTGAVNLTIGDLLVDVGDGSSTLVNFALSAQIGIRVTEQDGVMQLSTETGFVRGKLLEKSNSVVLNLSDDTIAAFGDLIIGQVAQQSEGLLGALPLPSFGPVSVSQPSVEGGDGYLILGADLQ